MRIYPTSGHVGWYSRGHFRGVQPWTLLARGGVQPWTLSGCTDVLSVLLVWLKRKRTPPHRFGKSVWGRAFEVYRREHFWRGDVQT